MLACEAPRLFSVEGEVTAPLMRGTRVEIRYELAATAHGTTRFRRELSYTPQRRRSRIADALFFRRHNERQSVVALDRLRQRMSSQR